MVEDTRKKDVNWRLVIRDNGQVDSTEMAQLAVLMDLRDELQKLNHVFECTNFLMIPHILREIRANTKRPKRKRKS